MARIIGLALLALLLTGCAPSGTFRYPCQDPANWDKPECKPPICTVNGACPEDLVDLEKINNSNATDEATQP